MLIKIYIDYLRCFLLCSLKKGNMYKTIQINKKQVRLHRYIMECYLGRKLTKDEIVHHKDGDKLNNNISNLELLSRAEHIKKHYYEIGGQKNQFKKKYNINREEILKLYQNPENTHKRISKTLGCSASRIAQILGKHARKQIYCCKCGNKARYIKKRLCNKCYQKEYYNEHK